MRIGTEKNVTVFAWQKPENGVKGKASGREGQKGSIFAGDMKFAAAQDPIAQKKAKARKEAMKIVGDVFAADKEIDRDISERRDRVHALKQEKLENQKEIDWINGEQERLKGVYGVTDDSVEQKELELLRKCNDPAGGATGEEQEHAAALRERGLTEYQSRQLGLDEDKKPYQEKIRENDQMIEAENRTLGMIHIERLKSHPMTDAQGQAEDIMKAASQEIIGMVLDEAREHADEENKERAEQGEKIKEEREKREELIEKRRKEDKENEELLEEMHTEEMLRLDQLQTDVKEEVQEMLNKMKLVPEDIKGAAVDEKL